MIRPILRRRRRRGAAAVEMALLAPVLFTLLVGLWEVGRVVMVMNILNNAAREAARVSSSGAYLSSNNHTDPNTSGTLTLSLPSTNADFETQKKVLAFLKASGVDVNGAIVTISNTGTTAKTKTWSYSWTQGAGSTGTGTGTGSDPTGAADQLDRLSIAVMVPYQNVGWTPTSFFFNSSSPLIAKADWVSMNDVPLVISSTIPTKPLQSGDSLP